MLHCLLDCVFTHPSTERRIKYTLVPSALSLLVLWYSGNYMAPKQNVLVLSNLGSDGKAATTVSNKRDGVQNP